MSPKRTTHWQLAIVLVMFIVGCKGQNDGFDYVYQFTCWNGGVVIYDEKLVDSNSGWVNLDGTRASIPFGDRSCNYKVVGKHKRSE